MGSGKGGNRRRPAHRALAIGRVLLFPAIVVGVFFGALPHLADLDDVWHSILSMSDDEVAVLALLTVLNVVTYWPVLVAGLPGLSYTRAALVNQSSTSVAMTVPGGGALAIGVSYAMYSSWGFSRSEIALVTLATGIANFTVKLALPIVSVVLVILEGAPADGLVSGALIGVGILIGAAVVVVAALRDERVARWFGVQAGRVVQLAGRSGPKGWDDAAERFRGRLVDLLRRRWAFLALATVASQLSVFLVLLASLRFLGTPNAEIGWAQALAVFALVRLASAAPIVPGNVGLAELGYIGGLLLAGGHRTPVVAAVLVFRFLTYFLQIPVGGVTYALWRRDRRHRGAAHPPSGQDEQDRPDEDVRAIGQDAGGQRELGQVQEGQAGHH